VSFLTPTSAFALAVLCVTVVAAGCDGGQDPTTPNGALTSSPTASSSAASPGQNDLRSALLTVEDLPPGFAESSLPNDVDLGAVDGCPLLDTERSREVAAEASVVFAGPTGRFITEALEQMSPSDARESMAELARVPTECGTFTAQASGLDVAFAATKLDFASIGEETVAVRITAEIAGLGAGIEEHVVAARRGDIVMTVIHIEPGSADRAATESVARRAYEKVRG
jgi:hypothetical protein